MQEDPRIFLIIDQGQKFGPLSGQELEEWRRKPVDLLVDVVENVLRFSQPSGQMRSSVLNGGPNCSPVVIEAIRTLAENPGKNFTIRVYRFYTGRDASEDGLAHTMKRARALLDHCGASPDFILNRPVDSSISDTGHAYCANPECRWRVIKYVPELSSSTASSGQCRASDSVVHHR